MTRFCTRILIAIATTITSAQAQEVCVDLAKAIVFNQSSSFSLDEQRDINRADLCIEEYKKDESARSKKIEASYKFFSAGAAGSDSQIREEQKKQCESKFGDFWSKSIRSNAARVASVDALAVIDECVKMNSVGLRPRMTLSSDGKEFGLILTWQSPMTGDLKIEHVGPRDFTGYKCSAQSGPDGAFKSVASSSDVRTTIGTNRSFSMGCERPQYSQVIDGESIACYRETLVHVVTNGPAATLKIPQTCVPTMPGQRASKIEQRITDSEARIGALAATTATLQSKRPTWESKELPAAAYKTERLKLGSTADYFAWVLAGQSEYRHGSNAGTTKCDISIVDGTWVLTAIGGDRNVGAEGTISTWCKALGIRY